MFIAVLELSIFGNNEMPFSKLMDIVHPYNIIFLKEVSFQPMAIHEEKLNASN